MNTKPLVIVGSGLAGYGVARELRKLDRDRPITMVTRDSGDFYAKPSLSNALAAGKAADALVTTPADAISRQLDVRLQAHTRIERIDRESRTLATSGGAIEYGQLVLATGADPVRLPLSGDGAGSVAQVNDLDDYRAFRRSIEGRSRVAIIGAGLIGCEFANDLRTAGFEVTVIDPMARPLSALLPEAAGDWFAQRLAAAGVDWRFGELAEAVDRSASGFVVRLRGGVSIEADAVLSAVGLRPRVSLARDAGLRVERGIVVDEKGATSDANIHALGDCAQFDGRLLPYVAPIIAASKALASTLAGSPTAIRFGAMPVIVKTPACPAAIVAPAGISGGQWSCDREDDGMTMRLVGADGRLSGFALLGAAAARRNAMVKAIGERASALTPAQ